MDINKFGVDFGALFLLLDQFSAYPGLSFPFRGASTMHPSDIRDPSGATGPRYHAAGSWGHHGTGGNAENDIAAWLDTLLSSSGVLSFKSYSSGIPSGHFTASLLEVDKPTPAVPPPRSNSIGSTAETVATPYTAPGTGPSSYARNLNEAKATTNPRFMPIIRGDEARQNAAIHDQASFARAVDQVALDYGLDPNLFRAQIQKESAAMTDYRSAMRHEGDLGRAGENNTSIGIGQISRKFLDGREWSTGGPNDPRVGGETVSTEFYNSSVITQLRVAAANTAMRIEDEGGLENGLRYYVSGTAGPSYWGDAYLASINKIMQDTELMNLGR